MNVHNIANAAKPVFVISLLVLSIIGQGLIQSAYASHNGEHGIKKPVVAGPNTISFRNLLLVNQSSTLTIDTSQAANGILTINLVELDKNLNATTLDVATATATSPTSGAAEAIVPLTETGIDTGTFSGTLLLSQTETTGNKLQISQGEDVTVNYDSESQAVGRLKAELEVIDPGKVNMSDVLIDIAEFQVNVDWRPVTHPVKLVLLDGATLDTTAGQAPVITISYANAVGLDSAPELLNMYYKPNNPALCDDCVGWAKIRDQTAADPLSIDTNAKTITSDVANTEFGINGNTIFGPAFGGALPITEAQFALGFQQGIGGGGGGGLVKAGLVVNALAGAGVLSSFFGGGGNAAAGGSSGRGPSEPTVLGGTMNIVGDTPNSGFGGIVDTSDPNSPKSSNTVSIDKNLEFKYNLYENGGINNLVHTTMYFFTADKTDPNKRIDVSKSETYIMFNRGEPVQVVDPHGYFANADFEIKEKDTWNLILKYDITFAKPMPESHIVLRNWDSQRNSADKMFANAITVTESSIVNVQQSENQSTEKEIADPSFVLQSENQPTEKEIADIPLWVKNNAMWWHEKQIDDSDFVSGIEYLINEKVITIPETKATGSINSKEIPGWISNVAGFWSSDLITDTEFVQAMQWLITNGVMEVS